MARARHRLHLAEAKLVDGGVVVFTWQAFCRCGWSMSYPTRYEHKAHAAYEQHAACAQCSAICDCWLDMADHVIEVRTT